MFYRIALLLLTTTYYLSSFAQQFTPVQFIDQGNHISGITSIETADINNDSLIDIIVTQGYNRDQIAYYLNQSQGNFSTIQLIDSNALDVEVAKAVDINEDGWVDLVSICRFDSSVYWYPNDTANFTQKIKIDSGIFHLNDLAIHDFNGDNHEDIVVIGQHSIDIHFGDGNGNFTKNHILTTSTSPNILECIDLEKVDINNDGDMDLLVAETIGAVIYTNNGSGVFSPQTINSQPLTGNLVHSFDIDNDSDFDVLLRHGNGNWELYRNNGNNNFTSLGSRNNLSNIYSVQSMDFDNDSLVDLYGTYLNESNLYMNDSSHNFTVSGTVYQNNNINFIYESDTADLNRNGETDFIFASLNGYLAWHEFNTTTTLSENKVEKKQTLFYPNPASNFIQLEEKFDFIEIYSISGKLLKQQENFISRVSVNDLPKGAYLVKFYQAKQVQSRVLLKE